MTREQQKRLNAMCGDLAAQIMLEPDSGKYLHRTECKHGGLRFDKDSWRWLFCGAYKGWLRVPSPDGMGVVMLGASSREFGTVEISEIMEMMAAFGAERGVEWTDPKESALRAQYENEARN